MDPYPKDTANIYPSTSLLNPASRNAIYRPAPTTIVGAAYLQGGTLGLASYHFDADPEDETALGAAYISYEGAPFSALTDTPY